ncbi:helix-turn-helix domain-containing protein [Bifidobacterium dentium]|nr:helix-turn-helix transcriptional regulator [Bifidobacterium dentium]
MTNISRRIDELRKQSHLSQTEFGGLLGLSQGTVSKKLSDQIPFSADEVLRCAIYFDVSTEALYGREELEDQTACLASENREGEENCEPRKSCGCRPVLRIRSPRTGNWSD